MADKRRSILHIQSFVLHERSQQNSFAVVDGVIHLVATIAGRGHLRWIFGFWILGFLHHHSA